MTGDTIKTVGIFTCRVEVCGLKFIESERGEKIGHLSQSHSKDFLLVLFYTLVTNIPVKLVHLPEKIMIAREVEPSTLKEHSSRPSDTKVKVDVDAVYENQLEQGIAGASPPIRQKE